MTCLTRAGCEPANAALSGAVDAVQAVRDGGRLATITAGLPAAQRAITMLYVQVTPDGKRLGELARLAAGGLLTVAAVTPYPLDQAAAALARARHGSHGAAVVLRLTGTRTGHYDGTPN